MRKLLFVLILGLILINGCESTMDPSIESCLEEIKEQSRIAKEKAVVGLSISIREYEKFNNTDSALKYLKKWGYIWEGVARDPFGLPEFFGTAIRSSVRKGEYDDIVIVLVRFDYYYQGDKTGILQPIVCIDGELHENAKNRFDIF